MQYSTYSTLVGWWYTQLRALEEKMPESSKLLTKEYQELPINPAV